MGRYPRSNIYYFYNPSCMFFRLSLIQSCLQHISECKMNSFLPFQRRKQPSPTASQVFLLKDQICQGWSFDQPSKWKNHLLILFVQTSLPSNQSVKSKQCKSILCTKENIFVVKYFLNFYVINCIWYYLFKAIRQTCISSYAQNVICENIYSKASKHKCKNT